MSTIRCVYEYAPEFPPTDQHPDASRYTVGDRVVDAIGGEPTEAEVADFIVGGLAGKRRAIDAARDRTLAAGFSHAGADWHADPVFQAQLTALAGAWREGILAADATVPVRDRANVTHVLGRAALIALAGALLAHVQGVYAESWAAKDALGT